MDYKIIRKLSAITSCLLVALVLLACSNKENNDLKFSIHTSTDRNVYVYSSQAVDIHKDDTYSVVYNVIPYNDHYYAIVQEFAVDMSEYNNCIYCIDSDGNVESYINLSDNADVYSGSDIINDELLYITHTNNVERMNINTGEITYSLRCDYDTCGINSCKDGYVVISVGRIDKYDANNVLVASIENSNWQFFNGYNAYYEIGDESYLISDTGFKWKYYKLNFANSSSELIYDPTQNEAKLFGCSGQYLFDEHGEYLLDFVNLQMIPLAIWDDMNLQPAQYSYSEPDYFGVDNETFIQTYYYENGTSQIVIYEYEATEDYSSREDIVLGGFNCKDDPTLNWAVYEYNTSQSEYRIVIEDYSDEFGFAALEDAAAQKAALIQYFNEGNAPDIYYGTYFDYSYMADNGELLNLTEYMSDDFNARLNELTPSIRNLMVNSEGECYNIFSAYQIEGYSTGFDLAENLSIEEVKTLAETNGISLLSGNASIDIAINAIQYTIFEDGMLSVQDIELILGYAYQYGFEDVAYTSFVGMDNVTINDYLLWNNTVYSPIVSDSLERNCKKNLTYIGYPTINGSKHVINPFGQTAVSCTTEYPEECTQFMSYLLDEAVQEMCNLSCLIPVNDLYVQKMITYASDHSLITEEDYSYACYLSGEEEISASSAVYFYRSIESVDTVVYHDWGVVNIIIEEARTFYTMDKPVEEIAESLYSRLSLYLSEN